MRVNAAPLLIKDATVTFPGPETEKHSISGTVTRDGRGLAGASVTANGFSTSTGPSGRYRIDHLEKGRYRVKASFSGQAGTPAQRAVRLPGSRTGVDFAIKAQRDLEVQLRATKDPFFTDRLNVATTVRNLGDEATASVADIAPRIRTITRHPACGTRPLASVTGRGSLPALAPKGSPQDTATLPGPFTVDPLCGGRIELTVEIRTRTSSGKTARGVGTIALDLPLKPATIEGFVTPVRLLNRTTFDYGKDPVQEIEELPQAEITKLLSGLRMVAKGPERTFTAPVIHDGAKQGTFNVKIPGRFSGRYAVSIMAPRGVEVQPGRTFVSVEPGAMKEARWTSGYDCDVRPPGMTFTPAWSATTRASTASPGTGSTTAAAVARVACRSTSTRWRRRRPVPPPSAWCRESRRRCSMSSSKGGTTSSRRRCASGPEAC